MKFNNLKKMANRQKFRKFVKRKRVSFKVNRKSPLTLKDSDDKSAITQQAFDEKNELRMQNASLALALNQQKEENATLSSHVNQLNGDILTLNCELAELRKKSEENRSILQEEDFHRRLAEYLEPQKVSLNQALDHIMGLSQNLESALKLASAPGRRSKSSFYSSFSKPLPNMQPVRNRQNTVAQVIPMVMGHNIQRPNIRIPRLNMNDLNNLGLIVQRSANNQVDTNGHEDENQINDEDDEIVEDNSMSTNGGDNDNDNDNDNDDDNEIAETTEDDDDDEEIVLSQRRRNRDMIHHHHHQPPLLDTVEEDEEEEEEEEDVGTVLLLPRLVLERVTLSPKQNFNSPTRRKGRQSVGSNSRLSVDSNPRLSVSSNPRQQMDSNPQQIVDSNPIGSIPRPSLNSNSRKSIDSKTRQSVTSSRDSRRRSTMGVAGLTRESVVTLDTRGALSSSPNSESTNRNPSTSNDIQIHNSNQSTSNDIQIHNPNPSMANDIKITPRKIETEVTPILTRELKVIVTNCRKSFGYLPDQLVIDSSSPKKSFSSVSQKIQADTLECQGDDTTLDMGDTSLTNGHNSEEDVDQSEESSMDDFFMRMYNIDPIEGPSWLLDNRGRRRTRKPREKTSKSMTKNTSGVEVEVNNSEPEPRPSTNGIDTPDQQVSQLGANTAKEQPSKDPVDSTEDEVRTRDTGSSDGGRTSKRRAATAAMSSLKEPSLGKKLRQGDPISTSVYKDFKQNDEKKTGRKSSNEGMKKKKK